MKLLIYSDPHFCANSSLIKSRGSKYSTRLENQIQTLNWIEEIAIKEKCDKIICLGDFFDKPDLTSEELTAINDVNWSTVPHTFLVGNHEMGSQDLVYNSANVLSKIGSIITKPEIEVGYDYEIMYLPYILEDNKKPIQEYYKELVKDTFTTQEVKERIIFSHNDIKGIRFGQYESKRGFDLEEITNFCSLFVNGHLHNGEWINNKVLNLGNVTGLNFSEDATKYKHCIMILDTNDISNPSYIINPYAFNFYKLDVNSIEELQSKLSYIETNNNIGSIKVPEDIIDEARELCKHKFKELRLLLKPNLKVENNVQIDAIAKADHISQFKDYILENIENSDILQEELSLL